MVEYELSKGVPANLSDSSPYRGWPEMALQNVLLSSGSASAVCEDPVLRAFVQAAVAQFHQRCSNARINWKSFTRGFGLGIASFAVDNASPNEDREIFPVEGAPLQAHDFAGAKAKTYRKQNHGAVRFGPLFQKEAGPRLALARVVCICGHRAVVPGRWDCDLSIPIAVRAHK